MKLSDYRGKHVVLEWTNPECPFVRKHYDSANMQGLQKQYGTKDVVWLSVNSTNRNHAEFKTGAQMASWMQEQGGAPKAVLIDDTSATGKAYSARTTPQMFVIDPAGKIVYAGAIDDKRSANPADVKTAKNFVRAPFASDSLPPAARCEGHAWRRVRAIAKQMGVKLAKNAVIQGGYDKPRAILMVTRQALDPVRPCATKRFTPFAVLACSATRNGTACRGCRAAR